MVLSRDVVLPIRRIPHLLRPLRPPNANHISPRPRHFTQNSHKLLLISSSHPRPQLPFLHSSSNSNRLTKVTVRSQINRLISTERKARWKRTFRWQLRFHLFFWPAITLVAVSGTSARQLYLEQEYPTPPEWSLWSRWILRNRKEAEFSDETRHGAINWEFLGEGYLHLLERLETGKDSQGVQEADDGGILIEGVGKAGYDVSAKSGQWRQGYYEALMGTARVAENLDGWVKDKSGRGRTFPREMVPGPDNPTPAPVPKSWRATPPSIEDSQKAFDSAATYYARILTTNGFTTRMKTDAAMAWADWLDFKGLHETAGEVLEWGLDIAATGMKAQQATDIINLKTGAFKAKSTTVSENMLKTSTALAVHYARSGRPDQALPMLLSIMKVRRELAPTMMPKRQLSQEPQEEGFLESIWSLVRGPGYPPVPSSGDEPPTQSLKAACEQTGIMTYIGEILYATSSTDDGLSWTRDAVDGAEAVLWAMKEQDAEEGKEKCEECLETGLINWQKMASNLAAQAEAQEQGTDSTKTKSSWFGGSKKKESDSTRWAREQEQIEERIHRTKPLLKNRFGQVEIVPTRTGSTVLTT